MNTQSIIVKLKYEDDLRRATLSLTKINTYDAMTSWIAETYNLGAKSLLLKYKDEDGDLITVINDDDLQHAVTTQQKLFIHVFITDNKTAAAASRLASPIKSDPAAIIHPSNHNEEEQGDEEDDVAFPSSSSKNEMSHPQQQQAPSYPCISETPINIRQQQPSSNGMPHQQQQVHLHHQSPSSPSDIFEHFRSTAMTPSQQQQLPPPSNPSQSANGQQIAPPPLAMNGLPSHQHQERPPHQLQQQQPSFNGLPPSPSSQQQQNQPKQALTSYPLQPGTSQYIAPPSMNELSSHQQQQPRPSFYSSQITTQQSYPPRSVLNSLRPQSQRSSFNGFPPPQQHHHQGQQQQMPYPPPLSAPPTLGAPPTSSLPALISPCLRFRERPSQRFVDGLPPSPPSQQQHHQQQKEQKQALPSYPLQSGTSQYIAPPSMNELSSHQQLQHQPRPSYSSQITTQQSYPPRFVLNSLRPQNQRSSYNGLSPSTSLQQQHHQGQQQQMPYPPPLSAPPTRYGPPPISPLPALISPCLRFRERPSQRFVQR